MWADVSSFPAAQGSLTESISLESWETAGIQLTFINPLLIKSTQNSWKSMGKWKVISKNKPKFPLVVNARQSFELALVPTGSVPAGDIDPLIFPSLCLPFSSQNKVLCSSTLTKEIGNGTGGIILPVQGPLILTKICFKWDIYTNQYTLKCMGSQGKPSRTCSLISIKNKRLKIHLFLPNAERCGEGNVTQSFNGAALKFYYLYKKGFLKWTKKDNTLEMQQTSKLKLLWFGFCCNGTVFLEGDWLCLGRIGIFDCEQLNVPTAAFPFFLCSWNVLPSTPWARLDTNVRENSVHK